LLGYRVSPVSKLCHKRAADLTSRTDHNHAIRKRHEEVPAATLRSIARYGPFG
jgi:hypothetical protein